MPFYNLLNEKTGERISKSCSYAEYKEFLESNPEFIRDYSTVDTGNRLTVSQVDVGFNFKERMRRMADEHPNHNINPDLLR